MHIHEYQAKRLLSAYGVPTPEGRLAATPGEAEQAARDLPGPVWVVKAQIHAGGRGKVGGVKVCRSPGRGTGGRRVPARRTAGDAPDRAGR